MENQRYVSVFSFLWAMIRPYKWHYAVMLAAPILAAFHDFANSYALKLVVDIFSFNETASFAMFLWPISLFVLSQIYLDVVWRIADIAEWRSEPFVRQRILTTVYHRVQRAPYSYFLGTPSGSIASKIKGILDGYDNFWAAMHHDFTPRIANTIVLTATLAIVNLQICLCVGLWALIFFGIMRRFSTRLDHLSFDLGNHRHAILGLIGDNITNIFTILFFAARKSELKRLSGNIENSFIPANIKLYKASFFANSIAGILYWIMLISLFLAMIHLRRSGQVSSGDVVFVMTITLKVAWELWQLVQKMQLFMKNIGEFKAAYAIMSIPEDEPEEKVALKLNKPSVIFDHVTFFYKERQSVFKDLSLSIRAGEKVGLVGISGSGKSTLISLLLRNFLPLSGKILIDGQDTAQCSLDSVRKEIAIIPQDIMLFHRTIFENIRYGRIDASQEEVIAAARIANIHDYIQGLEEQYDALVGERGVKLSGGQRQRIAIARAVLKNAPILILDEATSALDTQTEQLIQASLSRLFYNSNTTVIAVAHRLSTIRHMDRIIVLDKGNIIAQGSHDMLIKTNELYKNLWETQRV